MKNGEFCAMITSAASLVVQIFQPLLVEVIGSYLIEFFHSKNHIVGHQIFHFYESWGHIEHGKVSQKESHYRESPAT